MTRARKISNTVMSAAALSLGSKRVLGANDRINIGVVGCGSRANTMLHRGPQSAIEYYEEDNIRFSSFCDVYKPRLEELSSIIGEKQGEAPKTYGRYQDMLDDPDVDAVMIMTVDHAHTPILLDACSAGKDIYCEKPMSMSIDEANAAVDAVRESGVICQIGTQRRSMQNYQKGARAVQRGRLGKVTAAELKWNHNGNMAQFPDTSYIKEEDLDWEGYRLNLPPGPFNTNEYEYWKEFREYSHGFATDYGTHLVDVAAWYLEEPYPAECAAMIETYLWKAGDNYDTIRGNLIYPSGVMVNYESRSNNGYERTEAAFYGTRGTLDVHHVDNVWQIKSWGAMPAEFADPNEQYSTDPTAGASEDGVLEEIYGDPGYRYPNSTHIHNWILAMRDRKDPSAPVEVGHQQMVATLMLVESGESGEQVMYDPDTREMRKV